MIEICHNSLFSNRLRKVQQTEQFMHRYYMRTFREFLLAREGGLFMNPGLPDKPGTKRINPKNPNLRNGTNQAGPVVTPQPQAPQPKPR